MQVGIIAPIKFLEAYCQTDIQYCFPRLILESPEYREFYQKRVKTGDHVFLDAAEPGWRRAPTSFDLVEQALQLLKPSMLISPSYMYDWEKTLEVAKAFCKRFKRKNVIAGCLEGTTLEETEKCMKGIKGVYTYVLPSHLYSIRKAIDWSAYPLYLDNYQNFEELQGSKGILVTSLPVKLGLEGRLLSQYLPSPSSLTFYEEEDKYPAITERNVKEVISYYV